MRIRRTKTISRAVSALALALALGACAAAAPPPPLPETAGRSVVLGPDPGFNPAALKDPWWRSPPDGPKLFSVVDLKGAPALEVEAADATQSTTSVIGRRLSIPLLAMPYLQWAWYLEPAIFGGGPNDGLERGLHLSIGFYGGAQESPQLTDFLFGTGPAGYPLFDRRLDLTFGGVGAPRPEDAAQRMTAVDDRGVTYVLRKHNFGQAGSWKLEALDLGKLYQQFWPHDRMNLVRVTYIAVGGLRGRPTLASTAGPIPLGYVAEIALTR